MCRTGAQCGCSGGRSGFPAAAAAAVLLSMAVIMFVVTHAVILLAAAVTFLGVMGTLTWAMRRVARPQRATVTLRSAGPAHAIPAPPKAIEGTTLIGVPVLTYNKTARKLEAAVPPERTMKP